MRAVLGRDGQLMSEQETLLYPEVIMVRFCFALVTLKQLNLERKQA
jgi:hypothetical protein